MRPYDLVSTKARPKGNIYLRFLSRIPETQLKCDFSSKYEAKKRFLT